MLKERLGIDEKDSKILNWFMKDPFLSQNEIAERLKLSQPSINARIQKLKTKGILNFDVGMSFNKTNLFLSRIDFTATDPNKVLDNLKKCTFFANGFIMSGKNNVSVFFINETMKKADEIINEHLRSNPLISDINVSFIVTAANDYLFKMDLEQATAEKCYKPNSCSICENVKTDKKIPHDHIEKQQTYKPSNYKRYNPSDDNYTSV